MDTVRSALTHSPVAGDSDELASALVAANLPVDDLTEPDRVFVRFSDEDGKTLAFGGYEIYGPDALLRSIVVLPEHRADASVARSSINSHAVLTRPEPSEPT